MTNPGREKLMGETDRLWTPAGVTKLAPSIGGYNAETGGTIVVHSFRFHSAKHGKTRIVKILADDSMSKAQIEEMAAGSLESWLTEIEEKAQHKVGKHAPRSIAERQEVGKAIREFREYAKKRRESTNARIYYPVAKVG